MIYNEYVTKQIELLNKTIVWAPTRFINARIGKRCSIGAFVVLHGCTIGDECKIESFAFIPPHVHIGDRVFIGPHVCFTNDKWPTVTEDWEHLDTWIENEVAIGANVTLLPGVWVHERALIGAGSLVTRDVPADEVVTGVW